MKRSNKGIDWKAVRCNECGKDFDVRTGVRAYFKEPVGTRMILCSKVCAEAWAIDGRVK